MSSDIATSAVSGSKTGTALDLIPPITEPLGRYWDQPAREDILVDDLWALMTQATFARLPEYSSSVPSGTYDGKMWKREVLQHVGAPGEWRVKGTGLWYLCWYQPYPADPKQIGIGSRRILIV